MQSLRFADLVTIAFYFVVVIGFGIWSSFKNRGSVDGFFIARRSIHFMPVGASLFASCIGTSLFIGLSGSAADSGIGVTGFELNAILALTLLGWVFVPVYMRAGVYTMPEYIKKRFGGNRIRMLLSVMSLMMNMFIRITADLFAGALFIKLYLNLDLYFSIGLLLTLSALFTIGGATAVIWTDFIQTVFMIVGAFILALISFGKVGGYHGVVEYYSYAISSNTLFSNSTCGLPPADYFNLHRAPDRDFPWPGMTFGLTISAVWYWCSDQVIVQRALAAKNLTHARAGCIFAGYLKLLPYFIIILPGMISRIIFNEEIGCSDPESCMKHCGSPNSCSNIAYPKLIIDVMPDGLRGLMVAVMLAALMSSLTSVFNSCSVIFTMDLWKQFRKHAREIELMIVGRVFIIAFVIFSLFWIPIIEMSQGSKLFDYIQSITSFLAPPICSIYVQAILFKRINEPGAFYGLIIGLVSGLVRFVWEFSYNQPPCGYPDNRPAVIAKVHFLHFGVISFLITSCATWCISLMTPPIEDKYIRRLTYFSIDEELEREPREEELISDQDIDQSNRNSGFLDKLSHENLSKYSGDSASKWQKSLLWICGIEKFLNTDHKNKAAEPIDTCIKQDLGSKNLCDANAVLALALCGFCYAFFNKFD